MEKLIACPFCGDPMARCDGWIEHVAPIADCPISTEQFANVAAWNRRAEVASPALDAALIKSKASGPPIPMDEILETAKAEPAGDLVATIRAAIDTHIEIHCNSCYGREGGLDGLDDAARAILALFQPQMEAAEGLMRAAMTVLNELDTHGSASNNDWVKFGSAIDTAIAAGLGRESHD